MTITLLTPGPTTATLLQVAPPSVLACNVVVDVDPAQRISTVVAEVGVASKLAGGESEESIVTAVVSTETAFVPVTAVARITLTSFGIEGR